MVDQEFPTVVAGDFNYMDGPNEKRGGPPFMEDIGSSEFDEFLHAIGLMDLDFVGPRFS